MEFLTIIIALLVGGGAGFGIFRVFNKKKNDELDKQADLAIQEARLSAKRILDEAEVKSEKLIAQAEAKNEQIKQRKIQETQERFNKYRAEFENEKAQHKIDLKDREINVVNMEKDFQQKQKEFQSKVDQLEGREVEIKEIRENLDKQLKIVNKKREELEAATDLQIKELESIAKLSEAEAKEHLIETIRGKAENEAMALVKDTIEQAKLTASKESKKIVLQTIQRMCAEIGRAHV